MELKDLKFLVAGSLLSGRIRESSHDGGRTQVIHSLSQLEIIEAVRVSQMIWEEVCRQDRE
jgi:hypothetical protein